MIILIQNAFDHSFGEIRITVRLLNARAVVLSCLQDSKLSRGRGVQTWCLRRQPKGTRIVHGFYKAAPSWPLRKDLNASGKRVGAALPVTIAEAQLNEHVRQAGNVLRPSLADGGRVVHVGPARRVCPGPQRL